jgi:hypothetical protein
VASLPQAGRAFAAESNAPPATAVRSPCVIEQRSRGVCELRFVKLTVGHRLPKLACRID